jgi:hypothetical protein
MRTLPEERQTWLHRLGARIIQRAFWIEPWPWIGGGLLGFGGLAWGLIWASRQKRRDE